jgi:hypothetical protein
MSASGPIFVHSMFRTGSTYLFQCFRRASNDEGRPLYYTFYEAIHEIVWMARETPDVFTAIEGDGQMQKLLRHSAEGHYFSELEETREGWKNVITEKILYDGAFGTTAADATAAFFRALAQASPRRPTFHECRTAHRIGAIAERVEATHLYLWRNPWDQWWSTRTTEYFDLAHMLALNTSAPPPAVLGLRHLAALAPCRDVTIEQQFAFYRSRPWTSEESYAAFYGLWLLALDEADRHADVMLSIDRLTVSDDECNAAAEQLAKLGIGGIELSDARAPRMQFTQGDAEFFDPIERRVEDVLESTGLPRDRIDALAEMRHATAVEGRPTSGASLRAALLRFGTHGARLVRTVRDERLSEERLTALEARMTQGDAQLNEALAGVSAGLHGLLERAAESEARTEATLGGIDACLQALEARVAEGEAEVHNALSGIAGMLASHEGAAATATAEVEAHGQALAAAHTQIAEQGALIEAYRRSTSWRVTAPLRAASRGAAHGRTGVSAWLRLAPGSRPRRVLAATATRAETTLRANSRLADAISRGLGRYPALRSVVRRSLAGGVPGGPIAPVDTRDVEWVTSHPLRPHLLAVLAEEMAALRQRR